MGTELRTCCQDRELDPRPDGPTLTCNFHNSELLD